MISRPENENNNGNFINLFKKYQPINITGGIARIFSWPFSNKDGYFYEIEIKKIISKNQLNKYDSFPKVPLTSFNEFNSLHKDDLSNVLESDIANERAPKDHKEGIALVFVAGTADRANAMLPIAKKLLPNLPKEISTLQLLVFNDRFKGVSIERYAEQIQEKIKHKKVYLFGHSRGVLVNMLYALKFAPNFDVSVLGLFNLGGPLKGSPYAVFPLTWSQSIKEMRLGDDNKFLNNLRQQMIKANIPNYFYVAEHDKLVPFTSAFLEEQSENLIPLRRHGHLSMLLSNKIVNHILKVLKGDDLKLSLNTFLKETNDFITDELQGRIHLFSTGNKVEIMQRLLNSINKAIESEEDIYKDAKTIGDFVKAFMHDETLYKGKKPIDILNSHLNIFSFSKETASSFFIKTLITRYQRIPLIRNLKLQFEDLNSNEKQSLRQNF